MYVSGYMRRRCRAARLPDYLSYDRTISGATPPVPDAPMALLEPVPLKKQKADVFADDGSAVQYHTRAAFFLLNPAPFKMWAFPPTNNGS